MFDPTDTAANEAASSAAAQAYIAPLRAGLNRTNKLQGFLDGWAAAVAALTPPAPEDAFRAALVASAVGQRLEVRPEHVGFRAWENGTVRVDIGGHTWDAVTSLDLVHVDQVCRTLRRAFRL